MNKNRTYYIATLLVFILLIVKCFAFYNTKISYKYEVDLMKSHYISEGQTNFDTITQKEHKLLKQEKQIKISIIILSIIFLGLLTVLVKKHRFPTNKRIY